MRLKGKLNLIGKALILEGITFSLPLITACIYSEPLLPFVWTIICVLLSGILLYRLFPERKNGLLPEDAYSAVVYIWLALSAFGALPFILSGAIPSPVDAFFESVSGFTTTGASILSDVEGLGHGVLIWRSFTHFIGGMGVLVLIMALSGKTQDKNIYILRAEMPGPTVDKIMPKISTMARFLYLIYMTMTLAEILILFAGGTPLFDSIVLSFGTAGTGGFGIKNDSIASYNAFSQWVICIFMLLFGVNFNLYFALFQRKIKEVLRSNELKAYLAIAVFTTLAITFILLFGSRGEGEGFSELLRHSAFQVASILTTTGYSTRDFDAWLPLAKALLFMLMFIGGCAGSTAGGLKVSRLVVLLHTQLNSARTNLHPRNIYAVQLNGRNVDEAGVRNIHSYFSLYVFCTLLTFVLISFEPFGLESNLSAAVACINNVGPGFAAFGPASNYAAYSDFSKIVLSLAMLAGRLEFYPFLILLLSGLHHNKK